MSGAAGLAAVRARIDAACRQGGRDPASVCLVAVSKNQPVASIRAAHAAGQRDFGENRVQELVAKARELQDLADLRWHMIGSLQTNKVRELLAVRGLELVHSLDRPRLADALQQELQAGQQAAGKGLGVLLQVHATDEPSKHGCRPEDLGALLAHVRERCPALAVRGLMAMGPAAGSPESTFGRVQAALAQLRRDSGLPLEVLSLGMSGDFEAAIASGSTLVRIGTAVFGARG